MSANTEEVYLELTDNNDHDWCVVIGSDHLYAAIQQKTDSEPGQVFTLHLQDDSFYFSFLADFIDPTDPPTYYLNCAEVPGSGETALGVTTEQGHATLFEALTAGLPGEGEETYYYVMPNTELNDLMYVEEFEANQAILFSNEERDNDSKQKWKFRSVSGGGVRHILIPAKYSE